MTEPLMPIGPELEQANRRLLAERGGWPDGAAHECDRLARIYPEWYVMWLDACDWNRRPAGYCAQRREQSIWVYGATADELERAIEAAPPPWELDLRSVFDD